MAIVVASCEPPLRGGSSAPGGRVRKSVVAELVTHLERRGPKVRRMPDRRVADRIDRGQRPHHETVAQRLRGTAEAAARARGGGAKARAGAAEVEVRAGGFARHSPQPLVGRAQPPGLIASVEEVEQDRLRDQWQARRADGKADPALGEPALRPCRR